MKSPVIESTVEAPFRLDSMSPTAAPEGSDGVWFTYVITQGDNEITGLRSGSESEVKRLLDEMVERLNARQMGKKKK